MRSVSNRGWRSVRGSEIVESLAEGGLRDLLGERSAIYMWKRALRAAAGAGGSAEEMMRWIDSLVESPQGVVRGKRLGPFLHVTGLELRPNSLTGQQRETLHRWLRQPKTRRWLTDYLSQLAAHTPALYVGETANLHRRIREHVTGQTSFGVAIEGQLQWEDLDLNYYEFSNPQQEENNRRKAIEFLTNAFTIGGFTQRPG